MALKLWMISSLNLKGEQIKSQTFNPMSVKIWKNEKTQKHFVEENW